MPWNSFRRTLSRLTAAIKAVPASFASGLAVVVVAASLAGCATLGPDSSPETKQKVVAERATARWQALIKGDLDTAYTYLSKGSKSATSLDLYKKQIKPGLWKQAKVESVECEKEICKVQMEIIYDAARMKGIPALVTETWIIEDGTAGFVYR